MAFILRDLLLIDVGAPALKEIGPIDVQQVEQDIERDGDERGNSEDAQRGAMKVTHAWASTAVVESLIRRYEIERSSAGTNSRGRVWHGEAASDFYQPGGVVSRGFSRQED
jgi:hypothetical protein